MIIRPAQPDDAPELARLFADAVMVRGQGAYGPRELAAWAAQGSVERFAAMLADSAKQLLVAEADGRPAGVAGLETTEIILLYAASDAPPGTGTAMLAAVEELARAQDLANLTLIASRNALSFYLRHGYAIVTPASRSLPGGLSLPVCLMAKVLDAAIHKTETNPA